MMYHVVPGSQQVEKSNDGSFELCAASSVDSGWRERLPDDGLANVGGDEERNSRAEAVSLLQELVQKQHNQASNKQLKNVNEITVLLLCC